MKKFFLTGVVSMMISSAAYADKVDATITEQYQTVTKQIPSTERVCYEVEVPIYGKKGSGASAGDVLGGMIIGGLLGKGATGQDNGAAAGAVIGGMIAADKKQTKEEIVGYRLETRCQNKTTYTEETKNVYSHSIIKFYHNGVPYTLRFQK